MYKKWKSFLLIGTGVLIFAFMFSVWIGCQREYEDKAKYALTQTKIAEIETALSLYSIDVGKYPTTEQGLNALWRPSEAIQNWGGPYIQYRKSTDPWDNPYVYRNPGTRFGYEYDLLSYGRDGKLGGVGFDADIWVGETTRTREGDSNSMVPNLLILLFVIGIVFGTVTANVAVSKGRNGGTWFFIGFLSGPIGLIISLCLPKKQKCPYCAELVKTNAIKCRFCHESLQDTMQ